jgi:hypothetical protein
LVTKNAGVRVPSDLMRFSKAEFGSLLEATKKNKLKASELESGRFMVFVGIKDARDQTKCGDSEPQDGTAGKKFKLSFWNAKNYQSSGFDQSRIFVMAIKKREPIKG